MHEAVLGAARDGLGVVEVGHRVVAADGEPVLLEVLAGPGHRDGGGHDGEERDAGEALQGAGHGVGSFAVGRVDTKENGLAPRSANPLILLAEWTGLEPATPGVTGRYSNQLNYRSTRWLRSRIAAQVQPNLASPRGFEPL